MGCANTDTPLWTTHLLLLYHHLLRMMFTRAFTRNSRVIAPFVGGLWANNVVQCDDASADQDPDSSKDDLFQGQCLKRHMYHPKVPYPAWDYNWDGRMTSSTSLEVLSKDANVEGKTRHIILIRHGQYDETHKDDDQQKLTKLGRIQAYLTGKRLALMMQGIGEKFGKCNITAIQSSNMTRARETAEIIASFLPGVLLKEPDPMLNEALPAPIIPIRPEIDATKEIDENANRIEAAFHKYIHRANHPSNDDDDDEHDEHEFEVIVCHGNVIRYFFCRALQIPPEAWLRMSIFNCSLTYIMVKPNGYCSGRMLGDIGHLGYGHSTFSSGHGFVWS